MYSLAWPLVNMENKLTGVGWLVNKLMKESTGYISLDALASYTEQALEMEKQQIIDAVNYGAEKFGDISEQYYEETYGKI